MSGRVTVRLVRQDDVTALLAADRDHLAPWDPRRPDGHSTGEFQRRDAARMPDPYRLGGVVLLADEAATPGVR